MSWVKYRNRRNNHEGICKESDFKAARKRTDKLVIVEKYEKNPNERRYEPVKPVKEPKAAKQAKQSKKNKTNKSKNE